MRRIIPALSILALTACDPAQTASRDSPGTASDSVGLVTAGTGTAASGSADSASARDAVAPTDDRQVVLFVGTSLTAGYGVGHEYAWPAVIQEFIDSAGLPWRVVNAGISGETSAGGLRRIDWSLQQPADVLVLELGANDALRGLDVGSMRANLDSILTRARSLQPGIALVLIGMEAPPNLGTRYTREFRDAFSELARVHDAVLVPFLLDGVAATPALNLEDGIHPNAAGHRILARTVWRTLEPVLRERLDRH